MYLVGPVALGCEEKLSSISEPQQLQQRQRQQQQQELRTQTGKTAKTNYLKILMNKADLSNKEMIYTLWPKSLVRFDIYLF